MVLADMHASASNTADAPADHADPLIMVVCESVPTTFVGIDGTLCHLGRVRLRARYSRLTWVDYPVSAG